MRKIFLFIVSVLFFDIVSYYCHACGITPDIVVALDGSGNFTTLQKAIDAVPSNSDRQTIIFIKRGLYNTEKLIIPVDKINVTLIGESREETIISYHTYNCTDGICPMADAAKWSGETIRTAATLTILGSGFKAENLTIQNTAGPAGQAQALTIKADKAVFINCDIKGYQDTIYFWTAGIRCYFGNCLVVGRTDYIYGDGIAVFHKCEIRSWGGGWITAPSTPQLQKYGFVFIECKVTYASNSPRAGDDGNTFRFGRPWHEYPKVAWLYCEITDKLNPLGWGDTWDMVYAATSTDIHLYEYKNTGAGASMSGRAAWAGLRAMTDAEALNYTVQKVLAGSDNWDPTAQAPLVKLYTWTGKGSDNNWLTAGNWSPSSVPASGEAATVKGSFTIKAKGNFPADLSLLDTARIEVSGAASVAYLSAQGTWIQAIGSDTLAGKLATKDTVVFDITGKLTLTATLSGVHKLVKKGTGQLVLATNNSNFSGKIEVLTGILEASAANSLGKGHVEVKSGAKLVIGDNAAFFAKARLTVSSGALLEMNKDITTSEFYIGTVMQNVGAYTSVSNPGIISGTGKVIVGRPSVFTFTAASSGLWDLAANYAPSLLPEAGETVICEKQMETTSTVFAADIIFRGAGNLRLRGNHKATGTITLEQGTFFTYNTGGTGMALNAPLKVTGDVEMTMESGSTSGSSMKLEGPVSGSSGITALNNGKGTVNTGTLMLSGNNSNFTGTWNLTKYSAKYPSVPGYITRLEGASEYAFGPSTIDAGLKNKLIISHAHAAWPKLTLNLKDSAKVVLNVAATVSEYILNGQNIASGVYSAVTHPLIYEGTGTLTVSPETGINSYPEKKTAFLYGQELKITGNVSRIAIYNMLGSPVASYANINSLPLKNLPSGVYIIQYETDGATGTLKFAK